MRNRGPCERTVLTAAIVLLSEMLKNANNGSAGTAGAHAWQVLIETEFKGSRLTLMSLGDKLTT